MVLKSKISFLGFLLMLFFCSCQKNDERFQFDDSGLTYKDQFEYSGQLRLKGTYIEDPNDGTQSIIYIFENGSFYRVGKEEISPNSICEPIPEAEREIPYFWGYFIIEGEYKVEERWATIENDSTLHFFKKITPEKDEKTLNERYLFNSCSNKPDSTNLLMD